MPKKTNNTDEHNALAISRSCKTLQLILLDAMKEANFHGEFGVIVTANGGAFIRLQKHIKPTEKL